MKLSIVDLAAIGPGTTAIHAFNDAVETARQADALEHHRIWFAEHHMAWSGASAHPELLIAVAAAQTSGIRLGSGAVLMNYCCRDVQAVGGDVSRPHRSEDGTRDFGCDHRPGHAAGS